MNLKQTVLAIIILGIAAYLVIGFAKFSKLKEFVETSISMPIVYLIIWLIIAAIAIKVASYLTKLYERR